MNIALAHRVMCCGPISTRHGYGQGLRVGLYDDKSAFCTTFHFLLHQTPYYKLFYARIVDQHFVTKSNENNINQQLF